MTDWATELATAINATAIETAIAADDQDTFIEEIARLIRDAFAARQQKVAGLEEAILAGLQQAIRHGSNNQGTVQDILQHILPVIAARVAQAESDAYLRCAREIPDGPYVTIFRAWAEEAESRARGDGE